MSTEADRLLAELDRARDDAERANILATLPAAVLSQLHAALVYRQFMAETATQTAADQAAHAAFTAELDAAVDDASRLRIIEQARRDPQRGPAWLAEWSWRRRATTDDWCNRYIAMCRESAP